MVKTKTIKIPEKIHLALKVYVAKTKNNITEFAGIAIKKAIKEKMNPSGTKAST